MLRLMWPDTSDFKKPIAAMLKLKKGSKIKNNLKYKLPFYYLTFIIIPLLLYLNYFCKGWFLCSY